MRTRRLRACVWNLDPKFLNFAKLKLELELKGLVELDFAEVEGLSDPSFQPADILIVDAQGGSGADFDAWLRSFEQQIVLQAGIWVPALIVADLDSQRLRQLMDQAIRSSWYFDVVHPEHLESVPVRLANLLRIHDHLHELRRYSTTLDRLQDRVNMLEAEVRSLRGAE